MAAVSTRAHVAPGQVAIHSPPWQQPTAVGPQAGAASRAAAARPQIRGSESPLSEFGPDDMPLG
jgi:hypothetical protein